MQSWLMVCALIAMLTVYSLNCKKLRMESQQGAFIAAHEQYAPAAQPTVGLAYVLI